MKLTSTLGSLAAGTAMIALVVCGNLIFVQNEISSFTPRGEEALAQPDGAMEIRRMLVGDADGNIDHVGLQQLRREVVKVAEKQRASKANSLSWHELGPDNIFEKTAKFLNK